METVDYKKKIRLCEKLGADKFQKFVFKVEEIKFKTIKKLFPRYIEWYDKFCDWNRKRQLKNAENDEQRKKIIDHYRRQKLIMRREFYREQNRNYHMNPNKPTEILHYLEWNKKVHKNGMIRNAVTIPCLAIAAGIGFAPYATIPLLFLQFGSLFINFQCVNIQNCNIYRFKLKEETMKKLEARRNKRNIERYSEAGEVVARSMEKTDDIPSISDIIDNIQTKEELEQLKELVQAVRSANQSNAPKTIAEGKRSGGKK